MKVIAIIGVGQIGSRHLQGLSMINIPIRIELVDNSASSVTVAMQRFAEVKANSNICEVNCASSIKNLPRVIDFAILATSADIRSSVLKELLSHCAVKNILLEKVLFQRVDDYAEVSHLLTEQGVRCWVNHPRRQFPFYHWLKASLAGSEMLSYQVQGGAWGLGCNGLHFLDLLAFLSGEDALEVTNHGLSPGMLASKRKGFVEFSGLLDGRIGVNPFAIFCHEKYCPMLISICSESASFIIDETSGFVRMSFAASGWKWEVREQKIVCFQSELTSQVVENVLATGDCELPTYAEAIKMHIPFLRCLTAHVAKVDNIECDICPIT